MNVIEDTQAPQAVEVNQENPVPTVVKSLYDIFEEIIAPPNRITRKVVYAVAILGLATLPGLTLVLICKATEKALQVNGTDHDVYFIVANALPLVCGAIIVLHYLCREDPAVAQNQPVPRTSTSNLFYKYALLLYALSLVVFSIDIVFALRASVDTTSEMILKAAMAIPAIQHAAIVKITGRLYQANEKKSLPFDRASAVAMDASFLLCLACTKDYNSDKQPNWHRVILITTGIAIMAILPSLVIYLAAYTKDKKEPENTFTCCTYNCFWDREKTYNAVSLVVNTAILIVRITLWQLDQPTSLYWLKNCFEIVHSLVCIVKFVAENEEQPMVVPSIVVEPPPPPPKFHCNTSTRYSAARSTSRPRSSSEAAGAVEISDGSKIIFTADVPGPESLVGKKDMAKVVSRVDASEKEVALNPVRILRNEAEEERAETARLSSFVGVIAVGDLVKSTLGPKGMYKILVAHGRSAGQVEITNGGSTIVKAIGVDNPAAKILVDMSRVQDDEVGDGTTSAIVLAAELLREAEKLIEQKIHPQIIIAGWRRASHIALASLEKASVDNSGDPEKFHKDLLNIARTTLSSKILSQNKEYFANLAVEAVLRLKGSGDLSAIQVIKKLGGCMEDSFLDDGFLLDKKPGLHQPKRIEKARILIANTAMDTDKIKVFGSRVCVDAVSKIAELELAEKEKMKDKVNKIVNHNINVFINRQLIYNYPEQLFADAGVMAIEHAGFAGIERLALVTGGGIVSTFDHPEMAKLGHCDLVEEVMIGQDTLLRFGGVPLGEACTVVIRGATQQILDEAERSLHDAFCVLAATVRETRTVYGGGCSEMLMANVINDEAARIPGKEAMAMEAFSRALRQLPTAIADNAGYDSAQLVSELRAAHSKGENTTGLDMEQGMVGCMKDLGITESFVVKRQVLLSASEAAEMILRVDNIIKAAPRRRGPDNRPC